MKNEISDHLILLAEKAKRLNDDVLAVEGTINEPLGAFVDDYLFYAKDILDYIAQLEQQLAELKEQYRWHSLEKDGLPELNQDVQLWSYTYREIRIGHFYDYEEGNETSPDIWFDDYERYECFRLDELPKKYQWRYLNAPEQGE